MFRNYFFSRHTADQQMIELLGGEIHQQFRGTISNIKREGDTITFTEQMDDEVVKHSIPVTPGMRVVVVAPVNLQSDWLRAVGNDGLILIPQNNRVMKSDGSYEFQFTGLKRLIKVEVITEDFVG